MDGNESEKENEDKKKKVNKCRHEMGKQPTGVSETKRKARYI